MKKRQTLACVMASILPFFVWFFIGNFYGAAADRVVAWEVASRPLVVESTSVGTICLSPRLGLYSQVLSIDEDFLEEQIGADSSPIPYSLALALFLLALFILVIFIYTKERAK